MPPHLAVLPRLPRYFTQDELFAVIEGRRELALFALIYSPTPASQSRSTG